MIRFSRLLFATLITYFATQAHGWAGGIPTSNSTTVLIWLLLSVLTCVSSKRSMLLTAALVTQLAVHFNSASHACTELMTASSSQMVAAHIAAAVSAWALMVYGELALVAAVTLLTDFARRWLAVPSVRGFSLPTLLAQFESHRALVRRFFLTTQIGRAPPVFA